MVTGRTYINFLNVMINTFMRSLVARSPKVLVSAKYPQLRSDAADLELALNRLLGDDGIDLGTSLYRSVFNAMVGIGIHKIGINNSGNVEIGGVMHDVGQPFADSIDQDDEVHDTTARMWEECQFQGNKYIVPLEQLQEDGSYDNLQGISTSVQRVVDPDTGQQNVAGLSQRTDNDDKSYKKCVELLDLWLPLDGKNGLVVTLDNADQTRRPLKIVEWDGPERGPYRPLGFGEVPNNVMPLAPVYSLIELHWAINDIYIKNVNRARNAKDVIGIRAGADDDANRIIEANDLDVVRMDGNPSDVNQMSMGGVDQTNMAFGIHLKDLASWAAGNLESIGGLAAMSGTVGQDRMLLESASQTISSMQQSVMKWVKGIVTDLAWYLLSDPLIPAPLTKRIEGTKIEIPVVFAPEGQAADWISYNFDIEPYSMQMQTPQSKVASVNQFLTGIAIPLMPLMEQQQMGLDMREITRFYAKYMDAPELYNFVQSLQSPVGPDKPPMGQKPAKAPITTRNYTRENRSTSTQPGQNRDMMQMLMGGGGDRNGKGNGS